MLYLDFVPVSVAEMMLLIGLEFGENVFFAVVGAEDEIAVLHLQHHKVGFGGRLDGENDAICRSRAHRETHDQVQTHAEGRDCVRGEMERDTDVGYRCTDEEFVEL